MMNMSDMLNARKILEFVMFISRLFLRYPREVFCLLIYEYNISMAQSTIGDASRRAILVLFKSAMKNMACSGKKSDAI